MLRQSPFHSRVAAANETSLWSHWAGHLVVDKYQMSEKWEYVAIRNAAGAFDSSPLYKYRIVGPDAEHFLAGVLARDVRQCRPGQAQYTIWCDDRGYVNEDGVVFRLSADEFLLTAAEPNLAYLQNLIGRDRVEITDVTDRWGALAVQGPRSHSSSPLVLVSFRRSSSHWWRRVSSPAGMHDSPNCGGKSFRRQRIGTTRFRTTLARRA